ncbi:crotonase/enoyl-CoA hydratase family protein [Methyloferula stellata]|uniref:crotonase/enoyl-CoA hydratase family protein n=1 Tax=Methyloferula stellata TaxID=876270 RepID=UPI000A050317|nr:crotonase/enoyl-CoA hydratase family protein [Methyloferula stellata]
MRVLATESNALGDRRQADDISLLGRAHSATDALRQLSETAPLPLNLRLLSRPYSEIEVSLDPNEKALWMYWKPKGPASVTLALLDDLNEMHRDIQKLFETRDPSEEQPFLFSVAVSNVQGIFNLGGDLGFFLEKIREQDRNALLLYAYGCVDAVYNNAFGFDVPVVSIGIVEGDALGGGLECALSYNVLIAERGTKMGFPEVLFNSFPGMGAFSLLSRKLDPARAKKIIMSGRIYSSEEFYEMGLIDVLAEKGRAREAAHKFIRENTRRHPLLHAMNKVQNRVNMLTKAELREVTEIWVDSVMKIDTQDLRRMELLVSAQQRRLGSSNSAAVSV